VWRKTVASALVTGLAPEHARERQRDTCWPLCGAYLGIIAIAELCSLFSPRLAIALDLSLVLGLPIQAAMAPARDRPLFLALVLAPLVRVVSLAFPLAGQTAVSWYLGTSLPLFVAAVAVIRRLALTREQLGLCVGNLGIQAAIALAGVPLGAVAYLILQPTAVVSQSSALELLAAALVLLVCSGLLDELMFRGVLQVPALQSLGRWGLVYVSAVYTALYIGYGSATYLVLIFGVSIGFATLVRRSRSLLGVSVAHGLASATCYLLLPVLLVQPAAAAPREVPSPFSSATPYPAEAPVSLPRVPEAREQRLEAPEQLTVLTPPILSEDELSAAFEPELAMPADDTSPAEEDELLEDSSESVPAPVLETYVVRPGDTLFTIAAARGTTVDALVVENGISNRNLILAGTRLLVPARAD
jgi:uncharacterized protein